MSAGAGAGFYISCLILTCLINGLNCIYDEDGPSFVEEPPSKIEFLNDVGLEVNCTVSGRPAPSVTWTKSDGSEVLDIPGLRHVVNSRHLIFSPFQAHAFRPDVHSGIYRCVARNPFGTVVSRDIRVRAVVRQSYETMVQNAIATKTFPVILHCIIPDFVRDFVTVTSWIHGSVNILPGSGNSGFETTEKYSMLEDGQLIVWQVSAVDSMSSFQCRTFDRLTMETRISSAASIVVADETTSERRPKIYRSVSTNVIVKENERVVLPCVAVGNPRPSHRWFKKDENQLTHLMNDLTSADVRSSSRLSVDGPGSGSSSSGISLRHGSLVINSARLSHKGIYICNASNSIGSDVLEINLIIRSNLVVNLEPVKSTVDVGKNADLTCFASGEPSPRITWMKDGRIIRATNGPSRIRFYGESRIQVMGVEREDQGIYQCFATNQFQSSQRSAQLFIGDSPAKLLYSFIEQSLQPSWLLDGFELPKSDRFLMGQYANIYGDVISHVNITSVQIQDGGHYECTATNRAGQESHGAPLNIYGPPHVREVGDITAVAGKLLKIKCPVGGYPIESITFEKDGNKLPQNKRREQIRDGILLIENIERSDEGKISCRAENKVGQFSQMSLKLRVVVPPKITPFSFPPWVAVNERAGVQCIVSTGDPPFELNWFKDGFLLTNDDIVSSSLSERRKSNEISVSAPKTHHQNVKQQHNKQKQQQNFKENKQKDFHYSKSQSQSQSQSQSRSSSSWSHGGESEIGSSLRILIGESEFSSYLNIPSISLEHMGNYTCLTKSLISGETASFTATLKVNAAIKISQFSFGDGLIAGRGMRTQVICAATEGVPDRITWLKNNVELLPTTSSSLSAHSNDGQSDLEQQSPAAASFPGLSIDRFGGFSSILSIVNVSAGHSGNYKCILENKFGQTSHEAPLVVRVPPKFVIEPKDQQISIGTQVHIDCLAEGMPVPKIHWKQHIGPLENKEFRDVGYRTPGVLTAENGTLIINRVTEDHAGFYSCIARQPALRTQQQQYLNSGSGNEKKTETDAEIHKLIQITVNAPPRISPRPPKEIVRKGEDAILKCEVTGDEPLSITWLSQDVPVQHILDARYSVRTVERVSELSILKVSPSDAGNFECAATNPFGRDQIKIVLLVQEKPEKPVNLIVVEKGSRWIVLSWTKPSDAQPPVLNYILTFKRDSEKWEDGQMRRASTSGDSNSITLNDLQPATNYQFRLRAANSQGNSDLSDELQARTGSEAPTGPPTDVFVEAVTSTQLRVSWKPPRRDLINGQLLGYVIRYGIKRDDTGNFNWSRRVESSATEPFAPQSLFIGGLEKFEEYHVTIGAFNEIGNGPNSAPALVSTLEDVPSAPPENINCKSNSAHSLQISWDPPPTIFIHGNLHGFRILSEALPNGDGDVTDFQNPNEVQVPVVTSNVLYSLRPFTNYSIQVSAYTRIGQGVYSPTIFCTTQESVPSEPSELKAIVSSTKSVFISWRPPIYSNGRILRFKLYVRMLNSGREFPSLEHVPPHKLHFELKNLQGRESYEAWVTAVTLAGEGQSTLALPFNPSSGPNIQAGIISFGKLVVVPVKKNILLDCEHVGSSVVALHWLRQEIPLEQTSRIRILENSSLLIESAERNDSGNISCFVKNKFGSDQIQYTIKVQVVPTAPLLHSTGVSSTSIILQWKQNENGGAPILGFRLVYRKVGGAWEEINLHRKLSNYQIPNLLCGTKFQFFLTAYNKIGSSEPSETVEVSTKGSRPIIPKNLDTFLQINATSFYINLSEWTNASADCPITSHTIEYKPKGGAWVLIEGKEDFFTQVEDLKPETEYRLKIIAHNSAGTSLKEFNVVTSQINGKSASASINSSELHEDILTTIIISLSVVTSIAVFITICFLWKSFKRKKYKRNDLLNQNQTFALEHRDLDRKHSAEKRTNFLSHSDKILENEDDIEPYATFPIPHKNSFGVNLPNNYIYGPGPTRPQPLPQDGTIRLRNINRETLQSEGRGKKRKSKGNYSGSRSETEKRPGGESDEYDSLGSDSEGACYDPDLLGSETSKTTVGGGGRRISQHRHNPPVPVPMPMPVPVLPDGATTLILDQMYPMGVVGFGNPEINYTASPLHNHWKSSFHPNEQNNFELFRQQQYEDHTIAV